MSSLVRLRSSFNTIHNRYDLEIRPQSPSSEVTGAPSSYNLILNTKRTMAHVTDNTTNNTTWQVVQHHARFLTAVEDAKEVASTTFTGLKTTVQNNTILSIVLASVVLILLLFCCYIRRKYKREAQIVTRREYNQLLKKREARGEFTKERSQLEDQERDRMRENELNKRARRSVQSEARRSRQQEGAEVVEMRSPNAANNSFETRATVMSNEEDIEFVDVENGDQGFEIDLSPIKAMPDSEASEYGNRSSAISAMTDEDESNHKKKSARKTRNQDSTDAEFENMYMNDENYGEGVPGEEKKKKKSFFSRKKRQGSF